MTEIYLPTLLYFINNNRFSGSDGALRFMLTPRVQGGKEVDAAASSILGQLWHGPFCIEKSTVELEQTFPMSKEGIEEIRCWLQEN